MKCNSTSLHPAKDVVLYVTVEYNFNNLDGIVKSQKVPVIIIPVKTGIQ